MNAYGLLVGADRVLACYDASFDAIFDLMSWLIMAGLPAAMCRVHVVSGCVKVL